MSKVDGLRALREARYAASRKAGAGMQGQRVTVSVVDEAQAFEAPAGPSRGRRAKGAGAEGSRRDAPTVADELCGHQAIGGKRCIRAKDHPEKNHRYAKTPK